VSHKLTFLDEAHNENFQVDMRKVNLSVIRPWIAKKIVELIGFEDEVVVEYAMGLLEDEQQPVHIHPPGPFIN
jgi:serine/arginine repetitive matrix protein 1